MPGVRRIGASLFWGLCAVALVALYASAARQFALISSDTVQHWIDGAASGYAVAYASMRGL